MPEQLDEYLDDDNSGSGIAPETARYLAHHEQKLYEEIKTRKRFEAGLLFICCQVGSASLAWLLFSLQTTLIIIQVCGFVTAMLPGLIDLSDSFAFEFSSERWEVKQAKPMQTISKLALGSAVGWTSEEVFKTHQQIKATYTEIRESQNHKNSFELNQQDFLIIGALALFLVMGLFSLNKK
ncbi:hypothetical protein IQ277_24545 [Nostocales cyanobacterium LEGE 12452]|nr:hypothetical protein [Nostocales cyanobacterium LEGE 12452]